MAETRHPAEHAGCRECGASADTWEKKRTLPQIGQTYACANCGHEVYAYDAGAKNKVNRQWRPVTGPMAMSLRFFAEVDEWPDSAVEDLLLKGLERAEAIDYRIVEVEGLSQTEWADKTGRSQPTVSENVSKAKTKLQRLESD